MLRGLKALLAVVVALVFAVVATVFYLRELSRRGPAADEYRIYGILLTRLAAENNWRPGEVELSNTTLPLEEPDFPNWIPMELRTDKMTPPPDGVKFCGYLCGREFVKENLVDWRLNSTARHQVGFPIVGPSEGTPTRRRVVGVTRAGFNLWHTRAFLFFTADCNNYSREHPVMCVELGEAYFQKKNGVWWLDHISAMVF